MLKISDRRIASSCATVSCLEGCKLVVSKGLSAMGTSEVQILHTQPLELSGTASMLIAGEQRHPPNRATRSLPQATGSQCAFRVDMLSSPVRLLENKASTDDKSFNEKMLKNK